MPLDIHAQAWNKDTTIDKHQQFSKFAYFHLNLKHWETRQLTKAITYYDFIDATSGTGYIPFIGETSPVLHALAAHKYQWKLRSDNPFLIRAHFIERNYDAALELKKTLALREHLMLRDPLYDSTVYEGNYKKVLTEEFCKRRETKGGMPFQGLLYCDPNGQIPEFEVFRNLNNHHPRLDLLLHVSATSIKRVRLAFGGLSLRECIDYTGKCFWKIARLGSTCHQWTFLLGTNTPNEVDHPRIGLYSIDKPTGREILSYLNYTHKEHRALAEIPEVGTDFNPPDCVQTATTQVMRRSA